ncbi:MAG: chromosome segregation SMC family protein [archaeon]
MVYIKKLVMYGFKSFPRKTELPFTPGINVILGPNGSGKSNVSDALCFVLGRLSVKSMRAAKAKNLIFLGTKVASPSKEAMVEMVFDNSDRGFSIDEEEISIKRTVKRNGQSIYKINNQTKTRQEILSLLSLAGIDPNGFNIILQGEIQNFVKMHTEERRKVIEEVSGISIYESRKERSLKELDRTDEKLKEVSAILRERTSYLNNLEKERQQALKFKKLEKDIKKFKASIIFHDLTSRKKQIKLIEFEIEKRNKEKEKVKKVIIEFESNIIDMTSKINSINSTIQKSTGLEQEKLNQEIANIRAELAGLNVKSENLESKISSLLKQEKELIQEISEYETSIKDLQKESPTLEKNQKEIETKKQKLENLEKERKKFYMNKSELKSLKERIEDKRSLLQNYQNESLFLSKQIEAISLELFDKKTDASKLISLKNSIIEKRHLLEDLRKKEIEFEKVSSANEYEIERQNKLIEKISKIDTCPVCKSKMTPEHVESVTSETLSKMNLLKKQIQESDKELNLIYQKREILDRDIEQISSEISKRESDLINLSNIDEKNYQIKKLQEKIDNSKGQLIELEKAKKRLETNFDENSNVEQKYETLIVEVQEISLRNKETLNSEISFKQSELERLKISLKQLLRNSEDFEEEFNEVKKVLKEKQLSLEEKKGQEEKLTNEFRKLISKRDEFQKRIRDEEISISEKNNSIYNIDQKINEFKIEKARIMAELENFETEMLEFPNVEIIKTNKETLISHLSKTQETISRIGSVNLRSLEVYDSIKNEYDTIKEKVEIIEKEKQSIFKIINEINIKKKKTFVNTLNQLNEIFSRNFSQLSSKGVVSLELENRKDPFEGGVNIIVKTGHGKYFDVKSLSGGEQTIVALSLIFAIQELKPYYFYILDEIDAALDKRNSERLAGLLKKYMQKGQYIVITHNDEIITNATNLYGISMHDGVSKIVSLKI